MSGRERKSRLKTSRSAVITNVYFQLTKETEVAGEVARWLKVLTVKLDDMS